MDSLDVEGQRFDLARAQSSDVPALVALLADDALGADRESTAMGPYLKAFEGIDADPNHLLLVVRDEAGAIVGTMQLTLIPGLARRGATRLQIEAVRVSESARGSGLGAALFTWAHAFGREHGAALAQLTSDKDRPDAHRFYRRLGYAGTHEGFKRRL
jgi:GNAT superfamily N-acetyltransferase